MNTFHRLVCVAALCVAAFSSSVALCAEDKISQEKIVAIPVASDPTVSFQIVFAVGSQNDPQGKEGLSDLTASLISNGATKKNSYPSVLEKLFPLAAGYSAATNYERTSVSGRVHKDNLDAYYPLLIEAILEPAFAQADFDRIKSSMLNSLEKSLRYTSDEELGKAVLNNVIYAGTPYGHIPQGTVKGLKSITLDDVRSFYKQYYTRDNVVIGIAGGYDAALLEKLRGDLAKLPAGKPVEVPPPKPAPIKGIQVMIVEKDCNATAISMGYPIDVLRGQPDWYPLALVNSWLGEHRNVGSHLFGVIRGERGLNYGDYSYIEQFPPQGCTRRSQVFEVWIRPVPNEARHFALRLAKHEVDALVSNGLPEEVFTATQKFLTNYILTFASTTQAKLGYAMDDYFYGIKTPGHLALYADRLKTMTSKEANDAVKKHLQSENWQVVFVTKDAEALKKALTTDAPSVFQYPTPKPEKIIEEDKKMTVYPIKILPENVKIVPVEKVFEE